MAHSNHGGTQTLKWIWILLLPILAALAKSFQNQTAHVTFPRIAKRDVNTQQPGPVTLPQTTEQVGASENVIVGRHGHVGSRQGGKPSSNKWVYGLNVEYVGSEKSIEFVGNGRAVVLESERVKIRIFGDFHSHQSSNILFSLTKISEQAAGACNEQHSTEYKKVSLSFLRYYA